MYKYCPCGSGLTYQACCSRYHDGLAAPSAEALMRSRYSAYVLKLAEYLRATWHSSTRPATLSFASDEPKWCGLQILHTCGGSESERQGEVEFIARWISVDGKCGALHERSRFLREEGRWFYLDGELFPTVAMKVSRNAPCPCRSGKKFKQCCGR
ncbi:MAG TPA: YchJ family metal-binding protein [Gammaproteobacteria bacterium]